MNGHLLKPIVVFDKKTALELLMLLSLLVVWVVWPLRGTIAARNIALVVGAVASIAWLCLERPKLSMIDLIPICLLLCVPAWLLGLYIFNPVAPNLQWDDLRGTWLRVFLGVPFAIGLGGMINKRPKYGGYLLLLLLIWPTVLFIAFLNEILFAHTGLEFFITIFKSKIACIYFLMWSILFIFSYMHFAMLKDNHNVKYKNKTRNVIGAYLLFAICMVDLFALQSLNGFLTIFMVAVLFIFLFIKYQLKNSGPKIFTYKLFALAFLTGAFLITVWNYDAQFSQGKLHNFYDDVHFILNDDGSGAWKWDGSNNRAYPLNPRTNTIVNGSTYERVAWFRQGIIFLESHPFGLGYTSRAFMYYMAEQFPGSNATKTHSGWLDFALGAGLISLICVWVAISLIIIRAWQLISEHGPIRLITFFIFWSLLAMSWLWLIGELSEREYIEHFLFAIVFFCIITSKNAIKNKITKQDQVNYFSNTKDLLH